MEKSTLLAIDRVLLLWEPVPSRGTTLRSSHVVVAVGRRRLGLAACLLVALTAFLVRLAMVLRGGGVGGLMGYDDGVYYSWLAPCPRAGASPRTPQTC